MVAVGVSLGIVLFGILSGALTLVLAFLLFAGVYFLLHHEEPRWIPLTVYQHGIAIEGKYYHYNEFEKYWIIWEPPFVADLKLQLRHALSPVITLHIFHLDPQIIRDALGTHIPEEAGHSEAFTDLLVRVLRL